MKILAEDLQRLCYNAIQFSSKDSSLGGVVMFFVTGGKVKVYASDDYVATVDEAEAIWEKDDFDFHLALKELKELEKWLRDKEGEVGLRVFDGDPQVHPGKNMILEASLEDGRAEHCDVLSEPPDFSAVIEVVHSEPNPFTGEFSPSAEPFAIRAERFTKFRLLKTPESPSCKDGYPTDFLWDGQIVRWKCGPFLKGVVGPLTRYSWPDKETGEYITGIKELYLEEPEVLW